MVAERRGTQPLTGFRYPPRVQRRPVAGRQAHQGLLPRGRGGGKRPRAWAWESIPQRPSPWRWSEPFPRNGWLSLPSHLPQGGPREDKAMAATRFCEAKGPRGVGVDKLIG